MQELACLRKAKVYFFRKENPVFPAACSRSLRIYLPLGRKDETKSNILNVSLYLPSLQTVHKFQFQKYETYLPAPCVC